MKTCFALGKYRLDYTVCCLFSFSVMLLMVHLKRLNYGSSPTLKLIKYGEMSPLDGALATSLD